MPHARALPAYLGIGHQTVRPGSLSQPTKMSQENTGCPKTVTFKMLLKPKILIKMECCGAKFFHGQERMILLSRC